MADLRFQLVFQFVAETKEQFEELLTLTGAVEEALDDEEETLVDGHDIGLGYFNMFIHTNRPKEIFEKVGQFIGATRPRLAFAAGYRPLDGEGYISLYPRDAQHFELR